MEDKIDLSQLSKPLPADMLEFRVQSITKNGWAIILPYKDARVDMCRLDEVCGPLNWKREHTRDNANCIVSIWDQSKSQWVSKEDTGTESNTEKEKGLASDSFKRACFNWGIGRELYEYPIIRVKLNGSGGGGSDDEWVLEDYKGRQRGKQHWGLKLKEWRWRVDFDDDGSILFVGARDQNGKLRFKFGEPKQ